MKLETLDALNAEQLELLAVLSLSSARDHSPDWIVDLDGARREIADARRPETIARVLLDDRDQPVGWIAAALNWGYVWELQPLLIASDQQRRGYGSHLVRAIERLAATAGAITMIVGTSDETGATSLGKVDLYDETFARLIGAFSTDKRRPHAFEFWQRMGYKIVGVVPDAEGPGKPSITLARRIRD